MDHNLPIEQTHFFSTSGLLNNVNFQQTLQRGILAHLESSKIIFCRDSAPYPAGRANNTPPDAQVGWGGGYHSPLPTPRPLQRLVLASWHLNPPS